MRCLRAISDDPEAVVVRVKNRLDPHYNTRASAGYRDVLVNLRIDTPVTSELCAAGHVCEVQLLLLPFAEIKVCSMGHRSITCMFDLATILSICLCFVMYVGTSHRREYARVGFTVGQFSCSS